MFGRFAAIVAFVFACAAAYWWESLLSPTVTSRVEVAAFIAVLALVSAAVAVCCLYVIGRLVPAVHTRSGLYLLIALPIAMVVLIILGATLDLLFTVT